MKGVVLMSYFVSIQMDKNSKTPMYQQLGDHLYELIEKNILKPNTKLPPIRSLATNLKINPSTVVNAYKYLENKGVVYSQMGSGTYVAPIPVECLQMPSIHSSNQSPISMTIPMTTSALNFASMSPSTDLFPVADFKQALNEVLDRDKGDAFSYQDTQGYFPLRKTICRLIQKSNISTSPEKIQIISGAQQGIDLISKALLRYGDMVFIEKPTYNGAVAAFQSRGAKMIEIPLEKDGMDMDTLEIYLKLYHPKFIYMMTYYQNPTGISYSPEKKRKLLDLAEQYDVYIIEDDYLSDMFFIHQPTIPLKALDHKNRVIYIKSFSKNFMPGLRLGFMILPKTLFQQVLAAKQTTDIATSGLLQRTFERYISLHLWEEHVEKVRKVYQFRYEYLLEKIEKKLKNRVLYTPPNGGLSLWLQLPKNISMEIFCDLLLQKQIIIAPGSLFSFSPGHESYFRLSFADVTTEEIDYGIGIIKETLDILEQSSPFYTSLL